MSGMDSDRSAELLDRFPLEGLTPHSITDVERFQAQLVRVCERGYALDVEEVAEGIMGIAAPVMNFAGDVAAALCLGLPATQQADSEYIDAAITPLKAACAEISRSLGYGGDGGARRFRDDPTPFVGPLHMWRVGRLGRPESAQARRTGSSRRAACSGYSASVVSRPALTRSGACRPAIKPRRS